MAHCFSIDKLSIRKNMLFKFSIRVLKHGFFIGVYMNIVVNINGIRLKLRTDMALFSPRGADRGTLAMLSAVEFDKEDNVLDLGCGYGVVGIYVAKVIGADRVVMCDIDKKAVDFSKRNSITNGVKEINVFESDGFSSFDENGFTKILCNPSYHTDFSVAKRLIEGSYKRLGDGGKLYMVTKRREWYKRKIISVFGGVRIHQTDGYNVFIAEKRKGKDERNI